MGGGGGTGMSGIFKPLAGKSLSCASTIYSVDTLWAEAQVDANGNPYTRVRRNDWGYYRDSGWISGYSASTTNGAWSYLVFNGVCAGRSGYDPPAGDHCCYWPMN